MSLYPIFEDKLVKCAGGVVAAQSEYQQAGGGAIPTPVLQQFMVRPVPFSVAKQLLVRHHYLHSFPGGTKLAFGSFLGNQLLGALTLGAGPANAYALVDGATPDDCLTLNRLWLSDELPRNSESRFIGVVLRYLKRHSSLKFLVSYADPAQGHVGTIYQATGWAYTGLSQATPDKRQLFLPLNDNYFCRFTSFWRVVSPTCFCCCRPWAAAVR